ncbi:MAG: peptidase S41 [Oceanospirillaceae bacterium]|nr:peptidase S41 [Oceanospirillaceae bacterium]
MARREYEILLWWVESAGSVVITPPDSRRSENARMFGTKLISIAQPRENQYIRFPSSIQPMRPPVHLFFLLACVIGFGQSFGQSKFAPTVIRANLHYVDDVLRDSHYNPYLYASRDEIDSALVYALESVGDDSLSSRGANGVIQRFVSSLNNGHTTLTPPFQEYIDYARAGGTVFPLDLSLNQNGVHIKKSYTRTSELKEGVPVISIDGRPIEEVVEEMGFYVPAENRYFKRAKMESLSFPRLYWMVFGRQDSFEVEVQIEGDPVKVKMAAVPAIQGFEMKHDEVLNASMNLAFVDNSALLNPGPFGGDFDKYSSFIDSAFQVIGERGVEELYIDLRNNPGGDDAFSDYMVSYLANRPFRWCSEFHLRSSEALKKHTRATSDTMSDYARSILHAENGMTYEYVFERYDQQREEKRFTGRVYVLINRQTHSQACVTAAQITDYGLGTTIGEKTGEYPSLCASLFPITLPETRFVLQISKGYIIRVNGDTSHEGLIPEEEVDIPEDFEEVLEWIAER